MIRRNQGIVFGLFLLVTAFVGCKDSNPTSSAVGTCETCDKPEPKDSSYVRVEVVDFDSGERITSASIFESSADSVEVDTAGLYEDRREQRDEEVSFYAVASDYQQMTEPRTGNLQSDVDITIRLKQAEEDVTGPGTVEAKVGECRDNGTAPVTITVTGDADYVAITDDGEVIHEAKTTITGGGEFTFKEVKSGSYRSLAKAKGADPKRGDEFTVECEVPDNQISGFVRVNTEDGARIDNADIIFDGAGFDQDTVASNGIYDEMLDKRSGSIDISVAADGFRSIDTRTVSRQEDFREIFILEMKEEEDPEPEGPGNVELVKKSECVDGSNGFIVVKSANGGTAKLKQDGSVIDSKSGIAGDEKVRFDDDLTAGDYAVQFTKNGKSSDDLSVTLTACKEEQKPIDADFSSDIDSDNPLKVAFADQSETNGVEITDWKWTHEGEVFSREAKPENVFDSGGKKPITLEITVVDGRTDDETKTINLDEPEPKNKGPHANFDFSTNDLTADFDDKSSDEDGEIDEYLWEFGDGETSDQKNPSHTYNEGGSYDVKMTVTDDDGAKDTKTRTVRVEAPEPEKPQKPEIITEECRDDGGYLKVKFPGDYDERLLINRTDGDAAVTPSEVNGDILVWKGLEDGQYRPENHLNGHKARGETVDFDCGGRLSDQFGHEVNFDTGSDFSFINGGQRKYEELLRHGEVRPILGDAEPVGEVVVQPFFTSNATSKQEFALRFCRDEAGNNCFDVKGFGVPANLSGWTSSTKDVSADRFNVNEEMSIEAIHGDAYKSNLPSGPDAIYFSTSGEDGEKVTGKMRFLWKTKAQGIKGAANMSAGYNYWKTMVEDGRTKTVQVSKHEYEQMKQMQ